MRSYGNFLKKSIRRSKHDTRPGSAYLCCAIVPRYYTDEKNPKIGCFVLPNHPTWDLCITYRKGAYLTDAAKDFIAMVRAYWTEHLAPVQTN
ncbi:MAG: hypothetical protein PUF24_06715 [Oribacterium sp.]|nr:hypothetical protein [Oribacterium sp.]